LHSHWTNTSKATALCLQVFVAADISAYVDLRFKNFNKGLKNYILFEQNMKQSRWQIKELQEREKSKIAIFRFLGQVADIKRHLFMLKQEFIK